MSDLTQPIAQGFTQNIAQIVYLISALLFLFGLKRMSLPTTAKRGLAYIVIAMLSAVLITFIHRDVQNNYIWMAVAIFIGASVATFLTKGIKFTEATKMIALFTGLGGGSAAAIAAVEIINLDHLSDTVKYITLAGALIGSISFSGSLITYLKLQGSIKEVIHFPMQQWLNALILVVAITFGAAIVLNGGQADVTSLVLFFALSLSLGILVTIAISDADTHILIALFNIFTGIAIGLIGYVLLNPTMMITGFLVAAASLKLTLSMTKSMNRPISNVLFGDETTDDYSNLSLDSSNTNLIARELQSNDAAMMMAFAKNIIIVPGYGMAVAQAQHKLWEMSKLLIDKDVNIRFAVHPVAGRMPGHMNVLLAETGIPYESIYDIDEINGEFDSTDVVLLIGANDTTNTSARNDQNSPIFGMPILNVDRAKNVIVIKRAEGTGFSNIDNPLFYQKNTGILYGDAQSVLGKVVGELKKL
ncbi:MAG: NAD(P) transhydrogenase subunit beta [Cocleimonas sp.]|jgi:NAD(P) transhydrogenase subunit beta